MTDVELLDAVDSLLTQAGLPAFSIGAKIVGDDLFASSHVVGDDHEVSGKTAEELAKKILLHEHESGRLGYLWGRVASRVQDQHVGWAVRAVDCDAQDDVMPYRYFSCTLPAYPDVEIRSLACTSPATFIVDSFVEEVDNFIASQLTQGA